MGRPGVDIISRSQPIARSVPTDTGVWFVVGDTETAPADGTPSLITSMKQYEDRFGSRSGGIALYDAVDAYFREGGARVYISAANHPAIPPARSGKASSASTTASTTGDASVEPTVASDDAALTAALDLFDSGLGPGQVSIPGSSSAAVQGALLAHAERCNRVALLDTAAETSADLITQGGALHAMAGADHGGCFAPTSTVPGVAGGTTRSVPWSAIVAGVIGRNDAVFTANQAAAGVNGISMFSIGLGATFTEQEYEDINDAGVNMGRVRFGTIENYGYRSCVDPEGDTSWLQLSHVRLRMALVANGAKIAERYVFSQLDGRWRTISDFGGELAAMLATFYEAGALYGATADDAFMVDVGQQVNTPETIAAGELHAVMQVRMSPFAEYVVIEIVKVSTSETLAASTPAALAAAAF